MMKRLMCLGMVCALGSSFAGATLAVSPGSLSDPLTSFSAGSFTVDALDPVVYDASGAHFGSGTPGDDGRSYQRTIFDRYAQVQSWTAEVTWETTTDDQSVFFGVGSGQRALFGTPDWSTQLASASFWPETANDKIVRFKTNQDKNAFADTLVTGGLDPGMHRLQMTYTKGTGFLTIAIDKDYAGGPFVADGVTSNFPIAVNALYGDVPQVNLTTTDGWLKGLLSEPSRIFFGGDDGAVFRDLTIKTVPEPASAALMLLSIACLISRRGIANR